MENKTDRGHFESFLKENADGFLMVPSRKVWHGIYNSMHPDRKWPSMAVCLLILSAVMYIGVSNNNSLSMAARKANAQNIAAMARNISPENNSGTETGAAAPSTQLAEGPVASADVDISDYNNGNTSGNVTDNNITTGITDITQSNIVPINTPGGNILTNTSTSGNGSFEALGTPKVTNGAVTSAGKDPSLKNIITSAGNINGPVQSSANAEDIAAGSLVKNAAADKTNQDKTNKEAALKTAAVNNKAWVEDYAFRNKPLMNKFHDRSTISYYITPSYGYRILTAKSGAADNNIKDHLKDARAMSLEAGAVVQYRIADHVRLKGGLQLNYTNYTSSVTDIGHTLVTSLSLTGTNDPNRSSKYSVAPGPSTLNRSTVQLSLPVGADLKLAGRNKIQWYFGGTIQPAYVISGSSYILSQDNKFYVADKSSLRHVNLNVSAETFVSYKASKAVTLSVGPEIRYQLGSTYKSNYNYSEKLYNTGIKIGLSTHF